MTKAILLFSGGIDSTVALFWTLSKGWEIVPISVNYKGRPRAERKAVKVILEKAKVDNLIEIPLDFMMDVNHLKAVQIHPPNLVDAPPSYIPARNMMYYSIAAYFAEILQANVIVGGHNQSDPQEFPDSSAKFFRRMGILFEEGLRSFQKNPVRILLPLSRYSKAQVIRLGMRIGAPLDLTWSCEQDGKQQCGTCSSCLDKEKTMANLKASTSGPSK